MQPETRIQRLIMLRTFVILALMMTYFNASAQTSISGSNCVVPGTQYVYTISGSWGQSTSMTWSVVGGSFVGSSSGTPKPQVTVIWTSGTGRSISVVKSNPSGSASLPVSISPALVVGTISNPSQTINWNVTPSTISCSAATGGSCSPSFSYQWQSSTNNVNFTAISGATGQNLTFSTPLTQTTYYNRKVTETVSGTTSTTSSATVFVYPQLIPGAVTPSTATINYNTSPGPIIIAGASGGNGSYTYIWQYSSDGINWITISGATSTSYTPGNLVATTYFHVAVFSNGAEAYSGNSIITVIPPPTGVSPATNQTGSLNNEMNWTISREFDSNGNIFNESKNFYDNRGGLLQRQNKMYYRKDATNVYTHVLARQPIRDEYGRDAVVTLPAPIDYADFIYRPLFATSTSGMAYDFTNFDRSNPSGTEIDKTITPDPIGGQSQKGTLGWYYGVNNSWEPYTPVSNFPYSRQSYFRDGTGVEKKAAGVGESYVMGSGHEMASYMTVVVNELNQYLQVRNKFFTTAEVGNQPTTVQNQMKQTITRDANGMEGVEIQDPQGNVLMSARSGTDLIVNNSISIITGGINYFKLLTSGVVTVNGGSFQLYNMDAYNEPIVGGFTSGSSLSAGYYKLINTDPTNTITLTFSNGYTDVSYNYYNQQGKLIASIPPEGVKKLLGTGLNNYASRSAIPFISLYQYDLQGRVIGKSVPDQGTTNVVYRQDGKIRFSQNSLQASTGSYFYTNYDIYGRAFEGGQYTPDASGIVFGSAGMTAILENTSATGGLTTGMKVDVVVNTFDLPDNSHLQSGYTQDPTYLNGVISTSKKYSSIVNNVPNSANIVSQTWFNYDEEGKVVWEIKYLANLGTSGYKTIDNVYDVMGNLIEQIYQKNFPSDRFIHFYQYDPANQSLQKIYTNTVDNSPGTNMLQANFIYYLTGQLKRVELATNLQGIDYSYTLQGKLKAINNSNKNADPGFDGTNGFSADAFGEELDYFTGDYVNGRLGTSSFIPVNTSAITSDSYTGNIKAMTWYSEKPTGFGLSDAPNTYIYKYDPKYQFTESVWGTGINFGSSPASLTSTAFNKETVKDPTLGTPAYDGNGNILYMQRTDAAGTLTDKFAYNYVPNKNQLQNIVNTASGSAVTYAAYTYNAIGAVTVENTTDPTKVKYIQYDSRGNVVSVARDAAFSMLVVQYVYDETGQRIEKFSYNSSYQLSLITYYYGDVVYSQTVTNGTTYGSVLPQEYNITAGYGRIGTYYKQSNTYAYELSDHLGNVRAVIALNGTTYQVKMYTDYYPYGMVISTAGTNDDRHGFQGQYSEKDNETNWNAFELRMYDSRIVKWLQADPNAQFSSPYVAMGNNPVSGVDKDGGFWEEFFNFFKSWHRWRVPFFINNAGYNKIVSIMDNGGNINDITLDWSGDYLTGTGKLGYRDYTLQPGMNLLAVTISPFPAKQDYTFDIFVNGFNVGRYDIFPNMELELTNGARAAELGIHGLDLNLGSKVIYNWSWIDNKVTTTGKNGEPIYSYGIQAEAFSVKATFETKMLADGTLTEKTFGIGGAFLDAKFVRDMSTGNITLKVGTDLTGGIGLVASAQGYMAFRQSLNKPAGSIYTTVFPGFALPPIFIPSH
jgi:RHS repeat-associated protein